MAFGRDHRRSEPAERCVRSAAKRRAIRPSIGGFKREDRRGAELTALAAAGALVGVAAAIFVGTLNVKKPRRRRN
jgi:hypothetical protein